MLRRPCFAGGFNFWPKLHRSKCYSGSDVTSHGERRIRVAWKFQHATSIIFNQQ